MTNGVVSNEKASERHKKLPTEQRDSLQNEIKILARYLSNR
jgi:hypothetical protein